MKILTFMDEAYEAERIVKTSDSIVGYNGSDVVFTFNGVTNFTGFEIEGGWDVPEPTLEDTVGNLLFESAIDKATIASLEDTIGNLLLEFATLKGGAA